MRCASGWSGLWPCKQPSGLRRSIAPAGMAPFGNSLFDGVVSHSLIRFPHSDVWTEGGVRSE